MSVLKTPSILSSAMDRLRREADRVNVAFPMTRWTKIAGPGADTIELHGSGGFIGIALEPGATIELLCDLELPSEAVDTPFDGDALEGYLFSLYPMDIYFNGDSVFSEEGVPVASGPSLFTIVPRLKAGKNGEIRVIVRIPNNQVTPWLNFKLTTPGLRMRFEALDVAWAQLALAEALAITAEEKAIVEKAAALVPEAFDGLSQSALDAALAKVADALAPFEARAKAIPVHLIGHSHIDMNWLWTWPDTVEVIKRDFRSVLKLMDDYPELTFSHSQPATYEVIRKDEPELFEKVLQRITEGRWEPITTCWIEGDVNMASGEAMARQLLEGVTYTREVLGAETTTFHAPDTFGHAGNLPQLATSAGAVRYYHHRANPGQENQWPAYWWEGQDGSRILTLSTPSYNGDITARDLAFAAIRSIQFGLPSGMHFHGIGDHGGGPARQNLDSLRRFQKTPLLPNAFCSAISAYTDEILKSGASLPLSRGETSAIFEGCYTTHADTKYYNRAGENILSTADTLAALAGQNRTKDLREAWRAILFNQFHDILDGSAIHESYIKNAEDFEEAKSAANGVIADALKALRSGIEPGRVVVTNPLGWDRVDWALVPGEKGEGVVKLVGDDGQIAYGSYSEAGLGFIAKAPAFGSVSFKIESLAKDEAVPVVEAVPAFAPTDPRQAMFLAEVAPEAPYLKIETDHFRAYVRRDCGILSSFYDKRAGKELVGFGMRRGSDYVDTARVDLALNVLQIVEEHPHGMAAWHYDEVWREESLLRGAETRVVETGPGRCVLEVTHSIRASKIKQRITFYKSVPRVDFDLDVDWQELGSPEVGIPNLKAAFTAHLDDCEAWFETPFAAVKRPADGQEVCALRWANVGGSGYGIAVLNDSKYGYDALGCRLRLTLLRSGYDPDSISDAGRHQIRYSLYPHPGDWRDSGVVEEATAFNQPLLAVKAEGAAKSSGKSGFKPLLSRESSVAIACLKAAESGDGWIVRLYETAGRTETVELGNLPVGAPVFETSVVEDRIRPIPADDGSVTLTFRPWQVKTLLVEV